MATINLGAIKFNWKGAYNSGTSYAVDDVVSSGGNSYVCIQAHSNQAVGNATAYWNIMSSAGTNGTDGSDGTDLSTTLTTRGDIVFKGASALTRLPKGTAGYYLKQGANDPEWGEVASGAPLIKSYVKMCKGGSSISGFSASSPAHFSAYDFTFTPQSANSVFVVHANFTIGSAGDHTFVQYRYDHSGISAEYLGTGKGSFYNSNTHFDYGSFYGASDGNHAFNKGQIFYFAPNTTNAITLKVYIGQHSGTAYFGRSSGTSTDDYTALGMTARVDEYSSAGSSTIQYSEVNG